MTCKSRKKSTSSPQSNSGRATTYVFIDEPAGGGKLEPAPVLMGGCRPCGSYTVRSKNIKTMLQIPGIATIWLQQCHLRLVNFVLEEGTVNQLAGMISKKTKNYLVERDHLPCWMGQRDSTWAVGTRQNCRSGRNIHRKASDLLRTSQTGCSHWSSLVPGLLLPRSVERKPYYSAYLMDDRVSVKVLLCERWILNISFDCTQGRNIWRAYNF
jgi:hypothetical protein